MNKFFAGLMMVMFKLFVLVVGGGVAVWGYENNTSAFIIASVIIGITVGLSWFQFILVMVGQIKKQLNDNKKLDNIEETV